MIPSQAILCNSEEEWERKSKALFDTGYKLHSSSCGFSKWDKEDKPFFMGIFLYRNQCLTETSGGPK